MFKQWYNPGVTRTSLIDVLFLIFFFFKAYYFYILSWEVYFKSSQVLENCQEDLRGMCQVWMPLKNYLGGLICCQPTVFNCCCLGDGGLRRIPISKRHFEEANTIDRPRSFIKLHREFTSCHWETGFSAGTWLWNVTQQSYSALTEHRETGKVKQNWPVPGAKWLTSETAMFHGDGFQKERYFVVLALGGDQLKGLNSYTVHQVYKLTFYFWCVCVTTLFPSKRTQNSL